MSLITFADYQEIREQIDVSLDAAALSDDVIGRDAYAGAALRDVLRRDPAALSRTGAERSRARLAVIYLTAARLCPVVPALSRETHGDTTYQRVAFDSSKRSEELRALAEAELAAVLGTGANRPPAFALARGRRGR